MSNRDDPDDPERQNEVAQRLLRFAAELRRQTLNDNANPSIACGARSIKSR
jgi:hypothetical protein